MAKLCSERLRNLGKPSEDRSDSCGDDLLKERKVQRKHTVVPRCQKRNVKCSQTSIERKGLKDPGKELALRAGRDGARMGTRVTVEESRDTFEICLSHSAPSLQESKTHGKKTLFSQNTHFVTWTMLGTFAKTLCEGA